MLSSGILGGYMVRFSKSVLLLMLTCFVILSGCTNKALYNAIQQNRLHACKEELPQNQQACEAAYEKSYEDYERERQKVLKDK